MSISCFKKGQCFLFLVLLFACRGASRPPSGQAYFSGHKAHVVLFLSPDCPLCQSYSPLISRLDSSYRSCDIAFTAVFPGKELSRGKAEAFMKEYGLRIRYLIDSSRAITNYFAADVTPEVFFTDTFGKPLYYGQIDNLAYDTGKKRPEATEHYLGDALQAFCSGKNIPVKHKEAVGCFIEKE